MFKFSNGLTWSLALLLALCCHTRAADCASYGGTRAALPKEAADALGKAVAALKSGNPHGLLAAAGGQLLLVRRSVADGPEGRVGNMRLPLHAADLDAHLNIHITGTTIVDFAQGGRFPSVNAADTVVVRREVCEGEDHCDDGLPPSVDIPFLMHDLLQCNRGPDGPRLFAFNNGLFVTDMHMDGDKLPVGPALFIAKSAKGYRLAGLIVQH